MKTALFRWTVFVAIVVAAVVFYPTAGSAATVTVTVGQGGGYGCLCFMPDSVTINPGDTVRWTWNASGHSMSGPSFIFETIIGGIITQESRFAETWARSTGG